MLSRSVANRRFFAGRSVDEIVATTGLTDDTAQRLKAHFEAFDTHTEAPRLASRVVGDDAASMAARSHRAPAATASHLEHPLLTPSQRRANAERGISDAAFLRFAAGPSSAPAPSSSVPAASRALSAHERELVETFGLTEGEYRAELRLDEAEAAAIAAAASGAVSRGLRSNLRAVGITEAELRTLEQLGDRPSTDEVRRALQRAREPGA